MPTLTNSTHDPTKQSVERVEADVGVFPVAPDKHHGTGPGMQCMGSTDMRGKWDVVWVLCKVAEARVVVGVGPE
jgi:hypothetical protein